MTSARATLVQMETASTKEGHSSADVSLVGKGRCVMVSQSTYKSLVTIMEIQRFFLINFIGVVVRASSGEKNQFVNIV